MSLRNKRRRLAHLATHGPDNAPYHGEGHTHTALDTAVATELMGIHHAIKELTPLIAAEAAAQIETPESRQRVVWLLSLEGTRTALTTWLRANCAGCRRDLAELTFTFETTPSKAEGQARDGNNGR